MGERTGAQRRQAAKDFAQKWAGRGYEKGDTASFWLELLRDVIGMTDVTTSARFETSTNKRGYIDVVIRDAKTVVEQKSLGVDLDKPEMRQGVPVTPYQQAKRYADSLRNSERPDTIIVCDFEQFRIHDLDSDDPEKDYVQFRLAELPEQLHLLDFLVEPELERRRREEKVSLDAGALIGKVYDLLREQYIDADSDESTHSLNVLCVRLVFLLFAEDAGLFPKNAFYRYLKPVPADRARTALKELFLQLKTEPKDRDPYASDALKAFPYVNGGLFEADVEIPQLTDEILDVLLDEVSEGTDWSQISPTVFGGVFESTLNPETRRSGGMHYTSPQNIHKLIDPLFLDDLKAELDQILTEQGIGDKARHNKLRRFHDKIASLTFFDPACGSGNFLTETYIQLRKLENKILSVLHHDQTMIGFTEQHSPLKVSLRQFHGIEINDFAVNVATTALWIAELQANAEAETVVYSTIKDLPLRDSAHIVLGNALQTDWTEVLDPAECNYIIGNPPFVGKLSTQQHTERAAWFGKEAGRIDYVGCWFKASAQYMKGTKCRAGLVATNSVTQGVQVASLWKPLMDDGLVINVAHRSFKWTTEAKGGANVTVVIIGFSYCDDGPCRLWDYSTGEPLESVAANINAYLIDYPNIFVEARSKPLSAETAMVYGGKPADHGYLVFSGDEYDELAETDPAAIELLRPYLGTDELIKGKRRYCLWVTERDLPRLAAHPVLLERVQACGKWRSEQVVTGAAYAGREVPWRFQQMPAGDVDASYLMVAGVSSEARQYFPMAFFDDGTVPSNLVHFMPHATVYDFAVMTSRAHNVWLEQVGGQLETRTRYASRLVYNTFVWPAVDQATRERITELGQAVLDQREHLMEEHGVTLEVMYKPKTEVLYPGLFKAHKALDDAVESAYGLTPGLEEKDLVAHLFELYAAATGE
ncbi:DNA methyltransferase [Brachybacterium paraconglomeratum]|uniref:DNA methyltransferase n=1 Tax=Brachybacterium paraconglomeratum TaxID=173362 RepID=UPI003F7CCBFE